MKIMNLTYDFILVNIFSNVKIKKGVLFESKIVKGGTIEKYNFIND